MLVCSHCNKQPASVHVAELAERNDEKSWDLQHLCEECARELGVPHAKSNDPILLIPPFGALVAPDDGVKCASCGMALSEIRRLGRVGCEKCYETFQKQLIEAIEKAHAGQSKHVGRGPGVEGAKNAVRDDLASLQRRLKAAVESEAYEEAARIRDRIRTVGEKVDEKEEKQEPGA